MIKRRVEDLALFGGSPAFSELRVVGRPNLGDRARLMQRIEKILDSRWLTNDGPVLQEFERAIAARLQVRHCVAVCNGTVGLELAIRALGLQGEVILPSMTFVATPHSLRWLGVKPVFCDIDPHTHGLDPDAVEALITPQTSGIVGVHVWGRSCDVERLEALARRRGLQLMFDAAHAFGCSHKGRMIGNFGAAEVLSFHGTKFINSFEGGAIVTNDDALAAKLRLLRNFGFAGFDNSVAVGINGKMSEVSAAMGLTSLESMDEVIAINLANYLRYQQRLGGLPQTSLFAFDEAEANNYQYVVLLWNEAALGLSRDRMVDLLWAENVRVRRYFYPGCHRMQAYEDPALSRCGPLPVTESITPQLLVLPTGTGVSAEDIERICDLIHFAVEHAAAIRERPGPSP